MSNQAFNLIREGGVPAQGGEGSTTTPVDAAFRFVKYDATGELVRCTAAGEIPAGVSQYELIDGKGATLAVNGDVALVEAGGAIAYNDPIATDAQGRAVKATEGQMVVGRAITTCSGAGAHVTVELMAPTLHAYRVEVVEGVEGAVAANAIELAVTVKDHFGNALTAAVGALVKTMATTADQGDIAAAGTPVGTLNVADNDTTGPGNAFFTTTAAGLFSVRVTDTAAEACFYSITVGGTVHSGVLTFA